MYEYACLIVKPGVLERVRALCVGLAGKAGDGMFTTGLAATAEGPPVAYCSAGAIEPQFLDVMLSPALMSEACKAAGFDLSVVQCEQILQQCEISEEDVWDVLNRKGWVPCGAGPAEQGQVGVL